jgi:drug/metabolite transporter (DMT)-like permease
VALSLGVVVLGESIQLIGIVAMFVILGAVALLGMTRQRA